MGRGGSVVNLVTCVRKATGSNPTLAAAFGDLGQVLHLQLHVALVNSDTVSMML